MLRPSVEGEFAGANRLGEGEILDILWGRAIVCVPGFYSWPN